MSKPRQIRPGTASTDARQLAQNLMTILTNHEADIGVIAGLAITTITTTQILNRGWRLDAIMRDGSKLRVQLEVEP